MRIFTEAGGKCSKTVMSHLDSKQLCSLSFTIYEFGPLSLSLSLLGTLNGDQLVEFANTGTICELDLFGNEVSYYELSDEFDMPNDSHRIALIKLLIDQGFGDQITISHDIHTKHRLVR